MKYSDLREPMADWLARQLTERAESSPATKPTGELALGDGDLTWRGPGWVTDPDNPGGPLIPGPSWETWSVKEVPRITETLAQDLADAETRLTQARDDLAGVQDAIAGVTVDIDGLNASVGQAAQDAATAQSAAAAAQAAASQAATDAADALEAAQNASGKQQIYFGSTPPAVGDPDVLWINDAGVPHQWDGTGWDEITDARIVAAAQAAQQAHGEATAAQAAAAAAQAAADAAQGTANTAVTAAGTAQTAADNAATVAGQAATDAATAAGIAGGKADVLIQNTAPPAAMRKTTTLWIDTTGGANTPKRWTTGTTWVAVTDKTAIDAANTAAAAQTAATAAAAAALAAHQAADAADVKAGQALTSASGRNSRIISLNAPSGTVNPTTGLPLVTGDTWWRWDTTTARNVIGAWVWDGQWRAETLTDSVLGSLDVNKLLVLGTARMTEAAVQKIMGDAAFFNAINVEDLTVTGTGVINEAVVAKMAAALIVTQALRTEVDDTTHLYALMDSFGFRVINNDGPDGEPETVVALGPDGDMLLQLGVGDRKVNINSSGGVTAHTGTFQELWVNGRPIRGDVSVGAPRGNVAWGQMFGGYSNWMTGRDMVLGIEADLEPGRVYSIEMSTTTVETDSSSCIPMLCLHYTLDGQFPGSVAGGWDGSRVGESIIGAYPGFRSLPGLRRIIDLRNSTATAPVFLRGAVSLARYAGSGQCRVAAPVQPCRIEVTDMGIAWTDRGRPLYAGQSGEGEAPRVRTVRRFRATGWRTYLRGGAYIATDKPTQGRYSTNRECIFVFDDMVAPTAGAILHRVTLSTIADHWDGFAGGTGRWHRHAHYGGFPATTSMVHMVDTPGWPRGARMSIDLHKPERDRIQNGTMRGFGFSAPDGGEFYGKFSPNTNDDTTFIEIDMEA